MRKTQAFSRKKIYFAISLAAASLPLQAQDNRTILTPEGLPIFEARFFGPGDGPYDSEGDKPTVSTREFSELDKQQIVQGLEYWAAIIKPEAGKLPVILNIGTDNEKGNGSAISEEVVTADGIEITKVQAALKNMEPGEGTYGGLGRITLGPPNYQEVTRYIPSQLPGTTDELFGTTVHEVSHTLGVSNNAIDKGGKDSATPYFGEKLNLWGSHLRDDNGNAAKAGQAILCTGCKNEYSADAFDVRKDQGYFTGEHVNEVLAGAMPGIPVRMLDGSGGVDDNYMSHIELKNSQMSHQDYRNYSVYMEAELAALQDLGYNIDRRNFFGFSVYGDNQTLVNQNGYFQRNAEGTAYLPGQYNTATLGLGLHVYGSRNQIQQKADLMTKGAGGAGIRVDGEGNTLTINPGTKVYADGLNGRGIIFAYGKDHNFVQRGDVQALGEQGIAAEFNFGNNMMFDGNESRGSYIHTLKGKAADLLPELNGALVNNADISGRLAGKAAAISISNNALVGNINILAGAQLQGDILSAYNQQDKNGKQRLTQLTFGRLADAQGRATNKADANFAIDYAGNIQGINNLALDLRGGVANLTGQQHQLYSANVAQGALLTGNSRFKLNTKGEFVNAGAIAPNGTITVDGNYRQTSSGELLIGVNDQRGHDTLVVNGKATLGGALLLNPEQGFYGPLWQLSTAELVKAKSTTGAFSLIDSTPFSPTLTLQSTKQANGSSLLKIARTDNAYAQYAQDRNGAAVGQALSRGISANPNADTQKLYTTLDFSNPDGSTVRKALNQLSPSVYSAMTASSLQREQQVADAITAREPGKLRDDEWQAFIQPFGGNSRQNGEKSTIGYTANSSGVIFGAEKNASADGNLVIGLHGAASKQSVNLKDFDSKGNTSALELGVHARYAENPMVGSYMLGAARIGYEKGDFKRNVGFEDYSARNKADWTGRTAALVGGGGYRFQLNENVSMGPIATLTYTSLWRDGFTEKGADGSRLKLDSARFDSLRSAIGVNTAMKFPLDNGRAIKAEGQMTWNHELLDTKLTQDATFATSQGVKFNSKNTVLGRDSLGLRGDIRYQLSENVDVGAGVSSDLFRTGYHSVAGNLSLDWRF